MIGPIQDSESLGLGCFTSRVRGRIPPRSGYMEDAFEEGEMSVDRLDALSSDELQSLVELHDEGAQRRGIDRSFYGWHIFNVAVVQKARGEVKATPDLPRNPWHADVRYPMADKDGFTKLCSEIALACCRWLARDLG